MPPSSFQSQIQEAIPRLLRIAREATYNKISDNCKFILTEIRDSCENFHVQRRRRKRENDRKSPVTLSELMPVLETLYDDFYDINLHVYRSKSDMTIIDFRYYPKSSLDPDYRAKVLQNPPMLHCKVALPPWLSEKKKKYDINWEHYEGLNRWRLLLLKLKLKIQNLNRK